MKMMRVFLLVYWGMVVTFGLVTWFFPWPIPSDMEAAYQALPTPEITWPVIGITIVLVAGLALHIAASISLYKAKNVAPRMALASTLLMSFAYVLVPISVYGPVEQIFNDLMFMAWGGVLALAFSPSYSEYAANKPLEPTMMETPQVQTKRSIFMNPVVNYAVILFFLWIAFNNIQAYMAGAPYRHVIAFVFSILLVSNRILWLPQMVSLVEKNEVVKKVRLFMPFFILALIGVFLFL